MATCGHVRHVFLLLFFGHVIHVTRGADLVIRIPGGGQPKDGFYRLDYRYSVAKMYDISSIFVNNQCTAKVSLSSFVATKKCFMILTMTLRVMRGGLMLHFCLILQQHEMNHRILNLALNNSNMN